MIPKNAIDLIVDQEGLDQPSKWPGGDSGISIGIGYDLGQETHFKSDWAGSIPDAQIVQLSKAVGVTGQAAKKIASQFRSITISMAAALQVFTQKTLPHYIDETVTAFPGINALPGEVLGALVSIVYNRGPSMIGPRRVEMRAIRSAVAAKNIHLVADNIRAMKRLWVGTDIEKDMTQRREAEAQLVESAIAS